MINKDPRKVAEPCLGVVKERATVDGVVQLLTQPGAFFQAAPVRTMVMLTTWPRSGSTSRTMGGTG